MPSWQRGYQDARSLVAKVERTSNADADLRRWCGIRTRGTGKSSPKRIGSLLAKSLSQECAYGRNTRPVSRPTRRGENHSDWPMRQPALASNRAVRRGGCTERFTQPGHNRLPLQSLAIFRGLATRSHSWRSFRAFSILAESETWQPPAATAYADAPPLFTHIAPVSERQVLSNACPRLTRAPSFPNSCPSSEPNGAIQLLFPQLSRAARDMLLSLAHLRACWHSSVLLHRL